MDAAVDRLALGAGGGDRTLLGLANGKLFVFRLIRGAPPSACRRDGSDNTWDILSVITGCVLVKSIIIDTDPSPDDAVAFLMALGSPDELELLAVTTVGGNVPLYHTTRNALKARSWSIGWTTFPSVPVAAGPDDAHPRDGGVCARPDRIRGYDLPDPVAKPAEGYAPDKIVELVMSRPEKTVTLCCHAPLTNIALAMIREPRLADGSKASC